MMESSEAIQLAMRDLTTPQGVHVDGAEDAPAAKDLATSGIGPVDDRIGGFAAGGSYLVVGPPGPAKTVAGLQFLRAGLETGERVVLLANTDAETTLGVARGWGIDLDAAWREGHLQIVGFKDDFEIRAIRSIDPDDVMEELDSLVGADADRVAVDPGGMFLSSGARSLLGAAYLKWARNHRATVCTTFSVDGASATLPSSADWLAHATTGRLLIEWYEEDIYEVTFALSVPEAGRREEAVTVELATGRGLVQPDVLPSRRGHDRPGVDPERLLLISLGGEDSKEVEAWAATAFTTDVVSEPFEAVARAQADPTFGTVLIYAPRTKVREAVHACRALRPLTAAAIVFASDEAVRAADRVQILEAGADDCLSGGLDFRELQLRVRQAVASGAKPVPVNGNHRANVGGKVSRIDFTQELGRRAGDPALSFFCVLNVRSGVLAPDALEAILAEQVRDEDGDMVSGNGKRCAVLLQGAREGQLDGFLARLRRKVLERSGVEDDPELAVDVLSHPAEADRIAELLGT